MKKPMIIYCLFAVLFCISCGKKTEQSGSITEFSGSFVQRGRPVADLASYRIAYYEPVEGDNASGAAFSGNIQESDAPFIITDFGPRDELPQEIKKPSIYVVFSQPVVPLAKLGDPIRVKASSKDGLFSIEPPLDGVYRWYGSKLLSFEPDAESMPQRRYMITVSDRIKSLGGKPLQGERTFSFETERLSALEWELGDGERWIWSGNVHPEDAKQIRMIFSYPVNLEEIAKWIEVRAGGKTWPFRLERLPNIDEKRYRKEQGVLVRINDTLPLDTEVVMALKQGARSEPGWLGAKQEKTWNFHTLLPFEFDSVSVRTYSSPRTQESDSIPISLDFTQPVEPNVVEKYFSVTGFPALKKENVNVYGSRVVINNLPLEYEKNYTVRISADLKDLYGRSLGRAENVIAEIGEVNSFVYFRNSRSRMLEAGYPPKIIWEAQNPVSIRSRIAQAQNPYDIIPLSGLTEMDMSKLPKNSKQFFMEDLSPFLNAAGKGSVAMRWDYRTKSSWEKGKIYSNDEWLTVQVTNIGITLRYGCNMVLVWATHLSDGSAVPNADVELIESGKVVLVGKTDAQGLAVFNFPNGDFVSKFTEPQTGFWNNAFGNGFRVRVSEGSGSTLDRAEFIPNDSHNLWRFGIQAYESPFIVERERQVIFLFTDRGLYRPGETVTFRGIDRKIINEQYSAYQGRYKIEVSTGAYQAPVIAALEGNTTGNGGSFGSFTLPQNIDPGQYRIIYRRAGTTGSGQEREPATSVSFTVANFERLRFESSLRFTDPVVYQGEKLNASLSASWLAGGGLSGAPYKWYLTREPASVIPGGTEGPWRYWHFGPDFNDERFYVGEGEGTLGPDGKASIGNDTSDEGIEGAAYSYRLEASVQDTARQEISSRASVLVHPASFYIAARLDSGTIRTAATGSGSDSGAFFLSAGQPATLSWALVSPNGDGVETSLTSQDLSIQLVRHEWKQARQQGTGGRVNLVWERVEEIAGQRNVKITSAPAGGIISGVFNFTPDKSGLWEIRLSSRDQKRRIAATRSRFYVTGAGWVRWDSDDVDTISLNTDRPSYAPGETAKIMVRSPLEKGKYLLTLERENIISQKIIELNGSALTIDIPIEESYVPIIYAALSSYTVRSGPPQNSYYEPDLDKPKGIFGVTPIYID
ncbi:MAG: alpha-2-macroglobulin, partial [Treponema sp.]|nr:alpha-2-macroglobulin [Treponema sp.]